VRARYPTAIRQYHYACRRLQQENSKKLSRRDFVKTACSAQQAAMVEILADQRAEKRLGPLSGVVPGQ